MSIIVTQINKYGIVFGSDSNITDDTEIVREGKKIFEIPRLNSAMCIGGAYTVNDVMLDKWLPHFIDTKNYNSLEEFVELLSRTFETEMNSEEKKQLLISHIAGYSNGHPEMWCLSNTTLLDNGDYSSGEREFHFSEDFWRRDYPNNNLGEVFESDGLNYQIYVNSTKDGRVAFNTVRPYIDNFFNQIWRLDDFKFRHPKNIKEHESLVRNYIDIMDTVYKLSDYNPKIIGGKTQSCIIEN